MNLTKLAAEAAARKKYYYFHLIRIVFTFEAKQKVGKIFAEWFIKLF